MRLKLSVVLEAEGRVSFVPTAGLNLLDVLLAQLPTDEALLVFVPHVTEQLVRAEECFEAELVGIRLRRKTSIRPTSHIGCGASHPLTRSISFSPLGLGGLCPRCTLDGSWSGSR